MTKLQARQKQERKALHIFTMLLAANRKNTAQALYNALINSKPKAQEVVEGQTIHCNAQDVYSALVAGAKCEYNRSTDDYTHYKMLTEECDEQGNIPVTFLMLHHHKMMKPCETHARISLFSLNHIFDIPLVHWNRLNGKEQAERAELEAMVTAENPASKRRL